MAINRQEVLAKWTTAGTAVQGFIAAPGSGATITIWDSGDPQGSATASKPGKDKNAATRFKRLIMSSTSSADSGTSGVVFQYSTDDGTNWDTLVTYTDTAAAAPNIHYVSISFPRVRVRYTNSAAVLTTWRGSLIGDEYERASQ